MITHQTHPQVKHHLPQTKEQQFLKLGNSSFRSIKKPLIFGILNVTPDSFSDGGRYNDPEKATERIFQMINEGVDYVDIGAESTRPNAEVVSEDEEWSRLEPVLKAIQKNRIKTFISVDTYKYTIMQKALDCGVHVINDVRAMTSDHRIPKLLARYKAGIILMHSKGDSKTMQSLTAYSDLGTEVNDYLKNRIEIALNAGISQDKIVVDPGIGFAKTPEDCMRLLCNYSWARGIQAPIMIGLSKKSFIQKTFKSSGQLVNDITSYLHFLSLQQGASILRVHDVQSAKQILDIFLKCRDYN